MRRGKKGWITVADGKQVRTLELAEELRRFGGLLTLGQMCRALGCGNDATALTAVRNLSGKYWIAHVRGRAPRGVANQLLIALTKIEAAGGVDLSDDEMALAHLFPLNWAVQFRA